MNVIEELDFDECEGAVIDIAKSMVSEYLNNETAKERLLAKTIKIINEPFEKETLKKMVLEKASDIVANKLADRIIQEETFSVEVSLRKDRR